VNKEFSLAFKDKWDRYKEYLEEPECVAFFWYSLGWGDRKLKGD